MGETEVGVEAWVLDGYWDKIVDANQDVIKFDDDPEHEYYDAKAKIGKDDKNHQSFDVRVMRWKGTSEMNGAQQKAFMREVEIGCFLRKDEEKGEFSPLFAHYFAFAFSPYQIAVMKYPTRLREVIMHQGRSLGYKQMKGDGSEVTWTSTKASMCAFGIAAAMCYLHEHNIIHRDLRPEAVFLDEDLHPHLGRFGYGKFISYGKQMVDRDAEMSGDFGTLAYLAPEMLGNDENPDYWTAVDVYAYGMVLYELLTHEELWKGLDSEGMIAKVTANERPAMRSESIPASYAKLIQSCWAQSPDDRPTFREIVRDETFDWSVGTGEDFDEGEFGNYQDLVKKELGNPPESAPYED
jgi:serine/threonine protein kinase